MEGRLQAAAGLQSGSVDHEFTEDRLKSVRRLKPAPHANAENVFMRSKI